MTLMELLPRCFSNTFSWKRMNRRKLSRWTLSRRFLKMQIDGEKNQIKVLSTHWLQITMDDVLMVQQSQALHNGIAESSDKTQAESLVVVLLDEFVEVQAGNGIKISWVKNKIQNYRGLKIASNYIYSIKFNSFFVFAINNRKKVNCIIEKSIFASAFVFLVYLQPQTCFVSFS